MTFFELQIQLDLNPGNRANVLENADICLGSWGGYLFVDQEDGQCYLFDNDGKVDDISKVKRINDHAFYKCTSLTCIKIPDSVKSIGDRAFFGCTSLANILISDSVKSIGNHAFYRCTSLTSISIPDSVESIGGWAFDGCSSLKEVVFEGKTIDQIKAMNNYPLGINNKSIIKVKSEQSLGFLI